MKNLPEPELLPIHSCPVDPTFYDSLDKKFSDRASAMGITSRKSYSYGGPCQLGKPAWKPGDCGCIRCIPPFGRRAGFTTNLGIVAPPEEAVHGYVYMGSGWVLHASVSDTPRSRRAPA